MIVVCGDSFYFDDPSFPDIHWTSKISNVTNLSVPGASNFVIRLQIDKAIELKPEFIAVSFTSSLRDLLKFKDGKDTNDLLERIRLPDSTKNSDLVSVPYAGAHYYDVFNDTQLDILKSYVTEFVDLDVVRQKNYYYIKDGLETLYQSNIKFSYSLGGFDHKTFDPSTKFNFSKFENYETPINLWDYCNKEKHLRPWFHVLDLDVHNKLAEYFKKCLI